jgi:glutamine amidotransferase-like uncharacterized protein
MKIKNSFVAILLAASLSAVAVGCGSGASTPRGEGSGAGAADPVVRGTRSFATDILLFSGSGAWSPEVSSLKALFAQRGATYKEVSSSQLNAMSAEQMAEYGTFVWPGGSGGTQSSSLTTATKDNIRKAVRELGVSYIGFCAGAFVAVAPTPAPGKAPSYGLSVVDGPELDYYYLEEEMNRAGQTDIAMTLHTFADGTTRDIVWYGGPVVTNGAHSVVAKYPNGDAAISQMWSGKGWVILAGTHPAAPQSVRDSYGLDDADGVDTDLAWKLIDAAIQQTELPTF